MPAVLIDLLARGGDEAEFRYYTGKEAKTDAQGVTRAKSAYMKAVDGIVKELSNG